MVLFGGTPIDRCHSASIREETLQPAYIIEGETELGILGLVSSMVEIGDKLAICDESQHSVQLIDKDGRGIRLLGGRGEGPGDLMYPSDLFALDDQHLGVVSYSPANVKVFSTNLDRDFEKVSTIPSKKLIGGSLISDSNRILALSIENNSTSTSLRRTYSFLNFSVDDLLSADGDLRAKEFAAKPIFTHAEKKGSAWVWDESKFLGMTFVQNLWTTTPSRLYTVSSFDDYKIDVWDGDGTSLAGIEQANYSCPSRSGAELQWLENTYRGEKPRLSGQEAAILGVWGRLNGDVWVLPSRGVLTDQSALRFDIYDEFFQMKEQAEIHFDVDLHRKLGVHPRRDLIEIGKSRIYILTDCNTEFGDYGEEPSEPRIIAMDLPECWVSESDD